MYPDPEYYYVDNNEDYCAFDGDGSFKHCLAEEGVSERDIDSEQYRKCEKNFTSEKNKCRNGLKWSQLISKRHFNRTRPTRCDKYNYVYVLNLESNFGKPYSNCERPFVVQRIPNSNLILLVAKSDCAKNYHYEFYETPHKMTTYRPSLFCHKLNAPLYRRNSKFCFKSHILVSINTTFYEILFN
jgi:hypothetical protein